MFDFLGTEIDFQPESFLSFELKKGFQTKNEKTANFVFLQLMSVSFFGEIIKMKLHIEFQ